MRERHLGQALDLLLGGDAVPGHAVLLVELLDSWIRRERAVHEPRSVAEQVLDRHLALGRHLQVVDLPGHRIDLGDDHFPLGQLRQELRDGIGDEELAVLHEHHRRHRGERLGHGVEAEDGVLGHRLAGRLVAHAEGLEVDDLALARDERHRAGDLAGLDLAAQHAADALEPLRRQADLLRLRRRQALGPDPGAKNTKPSSVTRATRRFIVDLRVRGGALSAVGADTTPPARALSNAGLEQRRGAISLASSPSRRLCYAPRRIA